MRHYPKKQINLLSQQVNQLEKVQTKLNSQSPEQITTTASIADFVPDWVVVRSKVRYVDANIALRYADASQDVNIMFGLTTLFLGSAISFGVAIWTSISTTSTGTINSTTAILGTAVAFALLLTIIFLLLTFRVMKKAEATKKLLFESADSRQNITLSVK